MKNIEKNIQINHEIQKSILDYEVKTKDGRIVKNYINGHSFLCDPNILLYFIEIIYNDIMNKDINIVCGVISGACPLVTGVSLYSKLRGQNILGMYLRQEKKKYGYQDVLTTKCHHGSRVIIVDDVTTKGNTALYAINAMQEKGCSVIDYITLIDRNMGAEERIKTMNVNYTYYVRKEVI